MSNNVSAIITVGMLLDFLSVKTKQVVEASEEDRKKIIAQPLQMESDEANSLIKIRLEDGSFLNLKTLPNK